MSTRSPNSAEVAWRCAGYRPIDRQPIEPARGDRKRDILDGLHHCLLAVRVGNQYNAANESGCGEDLDGHLVAAAHAFAVHPEGIEKYSQRWF